MRSLIRVCALSAFLCLSLNATSWPNQQGPGAAVLGPSIFDTDEEVWVSVGPRGIALVNNDVISGQVNAIAVHPSDANYFDPANWHHKIADRFQLPDARLGGKR